MICEAAALRGEIHINSKDFRYLMSHIDNISSERVKCNSCKLEMLTAERNAYYGEAKQQTEQSM